MTLIDSHAHLNFNAFKVDRDKVIRECLDNNVWVINIGTQYDTSKRAVEIAERHEGVYAAVGLHPIHLETGLVKIKNDSEEINLKTREEGFDYPKYKELAQSPKVVAIGEIGLDYYWRPKTTKKKELFKKKQKNLLLEQLKLAKEVNLPVVFHCRMAQEDLIKILSENPKIRPQKAVAHSFVGKVEELQRYLDFGFHVGFNGIIFKKIEGINFEEVIRKTPLEKILIETDCPYLSPPPFQDKRNTPLNLNYIIEEVAKIKGFSFKEIAEMATQNTRKLFGI
jgi:TatD DNase family protein